MDHISKAMGELQRTIDRYGQQYGNAVSEQLRRSLDKILGSDDLRSSWGDLIKAGRVTLRHRPNGDPIQLVEKPATVRSFDQESRIVEIVASDETIDRMGDIIRVDGWQVENYAKNPVVLIDHDYSVASIVGRSISTRVEGGQFVQRQRLDDPSTNKAAALVMSRLESGSLFAVSVGFQPLVWKTRADEDGEEIPWTFDFIQQDLLEVSWVAVPANPNAVMDAVATGDGPSRESETLDQEQIDNIFARLIAGGMEE